MARSSEKTGKTVDEAVALALSELGVTPDQVDIVVLEEPSKGLFGFLGSKPAKVRVTAKEVKTEEQSVPAVMPQIAAPVPEQDAADPVAVAREFLNRIFETMKLKVLVEKVSQEDAVVLNLRGDDLGILIGKHGQTLDALQYLTNLAANRSVENRVRIILDVEDYRKRREDTLTQLALRLADKVKRRGERVVLEPMSPHERKIIHMALQNDTRVATFSEGDEPFRKVVIAIKK